MRGVEAPTMRISRVYILEEGLLATTGIETDDVLPRRVCQFGYCGKERIMNTDMILADNRLVVRTQVLHKPNTGSSRST